MKAKDKNKVEVIIIIPRLWPALMFVQAYRSIKNAIVYADKEVGKEIQGDEVMKVPVGSAFGIVVKHKIGIKGFAR